MYTQITTNRKVRQYVAGISGCLSMSVMANSVHWSAPAIPKLLNERADISMTRDEIAWMVSSLYIGNLVSPITGGWCMDKCGRKATLLYASVFSLLSWVLLYFAVLPYQFYVARFLSGIANGFIYTVLPIYIAEMAELSIRASIGNLMLVMTNFSAVYLYGIGSYTNYEGLIIISAIIPVLFFVTFIFMPESPYYYLIKGNNEKAIKSLRWFRSDKDEQDIINELDTIDTYVQEHMKRKATLLNLITTTGYRKGLIITITLAITQRFTGVGALFSYSTITIPENSISFLTLNQCLTILAAVWFITPLFTLLFIDYYNRRTLMIISCFGCGVTTAFASIWFYLDEKTSHQHIADKFIWVPFISFLWHAEFFAMGIGPLGTSIRGVLFPSNVKGKASAATSMSLAISSFVIGKYYLVIEDKYGMYVNYLIFSVVCFVSCVFIYVYILETKGKTQEQIQDELNNVKEGDQNKK